MLGAHRLVGLAHIDGVAPVERGFQRVQRRAPVFVARQEVGKQRRAPRLGVGRRRAQIGGVGRGRATGDELIAVIRLGVVGLDRDVSVGEPVGRVFGSGGDRRAGEFFRRPEVAAATAAAAALRN